MADRLKQALRTSRRQVREKLASTYQQTASQQICARIQALTFYHHAQHIAFYQAVNGEVDLNALWSLACLQNKYCYFPVLDQKNKRLAFLPANEATPFIVHRWGIKEPQVDPALACPPEKLDIIFIPLVVFDGTGTRLGMGGGYYDRTLEKSRTPLLIGVAYEFQHHPFIEPCLWDVPLTAIITPGNTYGVRS